MAEASPDFVSELHEDLARKWKVHGKKIEQIWQSMDRKTRLEAIKAGAADGVVLKNPADSSLGDVHKFIPEWNTQEVAAPGSKFLIDMLKYRATRTLQEQYMDGFNGRPGDYELIVESMQKKGLQHVDPFVNCYTFFLDGEKYGHSYKVKMELEDTLKAFEPAIQAGLCVPQSIGELVLTRQTFLLQCLNIIIGDILELGSKTKNTKKLPNKAVDSASESLSKLSMQSTKKADLPEVIADTSDRCSASEAYLDLLRDEPVALEHGVNSTFFTRPELVPDERGRTLPALHDRFTSSAVFDTIHNAVRSAAIWRYNSRLLDIYASNSDKSLRARIAQELSNVCQLEYTRCQNGLKRALGTSLGTKWLKRMSNGSDNGAPRLAIKGDPNLLTREDPLLCYLLRLCQPETTASKAVDWIQQLESFRHSHPMDWQRLTNPVYTAVGELISTVHFTQSLTQAISMPAFSRKKGQQFVSDVAKLETELNKIKPELDVRDFAAPLEMLLEPNMAEQALTILDDFIVKKTGAKIGFLYEDILNACLETLEHLLENRAKDLANQKDAFVPLPASTTTPSAEVQIQQRREKSKTRPEQSSRFEITRSAREASGSSSDGTSKGPETPRITVRETTVKTFANIFSRSEKRGTVPWSAFEAAMADAGFSVVPKQGSIYTFRQMAREPTAKTEDGKQVKEEGEGRSESGGNISITIHRPHQSDVEGSDLLCLANRLRRRFGWTVETFQAAA